MVFCFSWITSLYCSPVVGSVKVLCYCKIVHLIKKNLNMHIFAYSKHTRDEIRTPFCTSRKQYNYILTDSP